MSMRNWVRWGGRLLVALLLFGAIRAALAGQYLTATTMVGLVALYGGWVAYQGYQDTAETDPA